MKFQVPVGDTQGLVSVRGRPPQSTETKSREERSCELVSVGTASRKTVFCLFVSFVGPASGGAGSRGSSTGLQCCFFLSRGCVCLCWLHFQAGLALQMEKASQHTQLNSTVSPPEISLPSGTCHSSGITSD